MGLKEIHEEIDNEGMRAFMRALLEDVRALEAMTREEGLFESDVRRIGAEQEMFLVDRALRPANCALGILERLPRDFFTTELGQFNLEANLTPQVLGGKCLSKMEAQLRELLGKAIEAAEALQARIVLTGILPTLEKRDLGMESMTPIPRYYQLNHVMREARGGEFRTMIKGLDELQTTHDNVMLEACNTSFQVHFQVNPGEFAKLYNVAQVVTAPVLAAATNSPVLLRHRLWHETRVALFQQSIDTRSEALAKRGGRSRVSFGDDWVNEGVLEVFRDDIARFRVLISTELEESPLAQLERGQIPNLKALRLHNGTVYRWNRPCYGISDGRPHLRIENRVLPAGPTVIDEMANAAFFFGLMCAIADDVQDIRTRIPFSDVKENFLAAARYGLDARFKWLGDTRYGADELITQELLPAAREGLLSHDIDPDDVTRYLDVLEERVRTRMTGSQWMLDSLEQMNGARPDERYRALTSAIHTHQLEDHPVHTWALARVEGARDIRDSYRTVGQLMTTDVFTVHPEDLIDLAASVMDWEHLRHVPVEDQDGRLVGLVTYRALLRMISQGGKTTSAAVREVMRTDPVTVSPEVSVLDAIEVMRASRVGCLPVVEEGRLVGIVTESDLLDVSRKLLEEWLRTD